jgi:hypothetical protein
MGLEVAMGDVMEPGDDVRCVYPAFSRMVGVRSKGAIATISFACAEEVIISWCLRLSLDQMAISALGLLASSHFSSRSLTTNLTYLWFFWSFSEFIFLFSVSWHN